jgi:sec-independent protein translocase protein TatC
MVSIFLAMPFILYQLWAFIAPGLYKHEKRMVMPLVVSSTILYYTGMAFAYFVVFPLVFAFLIGATPDGVAVATDIAKYLDFVLTLFFAFGIAFEIPIATILLVWMGMTTPDSLREKRPYVVVGVFVLGMLLTPPDVISQTLLAVPMWLLFEAGIFFSRMFVRDREEPDDDQAAATADPGPQPPSPHQPSAAGQPAYAAAAAETIDPERFTPLTPEELDRELDVIEEEERQANSTDAKPAAADDPVTVKLREVQELRAHGDEQGARELLYEVLAEGNEDQRNVARNILRQLDN